jgi:hypothetical protein
MVSSVRVLVLASIPAIAIAAMLTRGAFATAAQEPGPTGINAYDVAIRQNALRLFEDGRRIFRFDTFGSEDFWGGKLRLHETIVGDRLGGVGPGLSPKAALSLGLKVDAAALPPPLIAALRAGKVDLDDPRTTIELLELNAVVGVTAFLNPDGTARSVGIQCALCHSTVDDALAPGIGRRLDGWGNRDLNIGAIVATAPNLQPFADLLGVDVATVKAVLTSWGPGRYDAELNMDGKATRPDGQTAATVMPSAFGLAGVNYHTWTGGWGTVTYWNAFVANTQMYGKGTFYDPRLDDAAQYPVAAKAGFGHKRDEVDLITAKLPALHFYQLALPTPKAPPGTVNGDAARRGQTVFNGAARCATCHVPPLFTEPGYNLHTADEIGIDSFQADRGPEKRYVTTPLRALFDTQKLHKGGFYHDGRFPTLDAVIDHYDNHLGLNLTADQKRDLIEYLKSL